MPVTGGHHYRAEPIPHDLPEASPAALSGPSLGNLSTWAFLLMLAGVGLRTNFREMSNQGLRPFIVGALGKSLIACLTLGLAVSADRRWGYDDGTPK
ncbi:MAG: hypothetical protein WB762_10275 [Candidatus Sulfotelmatobacter sp.]